MHRTQDSHSAPPSRDAERQGRLADPKARVSPSVLVFNPFAEGYVANGKAFTPVKHQVSLAEDLANLPQFLCLPDDIVLVPRRPSREFLESLRSAGFAEPNFVEIGREPRAAIDSLSQRRLAGLRPWAWSPDSVELLRPLFHAVDDQPFSDEKVFNGRIAHLYSKTWSARFLRRVLSQRGQAHDPAMSWLCSNAEVGISVSSVHEALQAVKAIRARGHHRVVAKQAHGLAGQNAIRLWEPEILPSQIQALAHAVENGKEIVVEPWLDREVDFSIQLEMSPSGLRLCGYTGLETDQRGQFMANWCEANCAHTVPAKVAGAYNERDHEEITCLYENIRALLEAELAQIGFAGPISIDAFVYREPSGAFRLKPVVEINPRYTMGRLALELMKNACRGRCGVFRLINRSQVQAQGFGDLQSYARSVAERLPLVMEDGRIARGAVPLNDPKRSQVCLATFEVHESSMPPIVPMGSSLRVPA